MEGWGLDLGERREGSQGWRWGMRTLGWSWPRLCSPWLPGCPAGSRSGRNREDAAPQPCPLSYVQPWPGVYKLLGEEPWWALESDLLGLRPLITQHLEERAETTGSSSLWQPTFLFRFLLKVISKQDKTNQHTAAPQVSMGKVKKSHSLSFPHVQHRRGRSGGIKNQPQT